jgi:Domain of unknown function (DUF4337)
LRPGLLCYHVRRLGQAGDWMSAHENLEHAEHAQHASHSNKKIALLISVLALFLALSETLGKSAQTTALSENVAASDLWAFYQAKHIRSTILRAGAEQMKIEAGRATDPTAKAQFAKNAEDWIKTANRYDDDPQGGEGRKQLMAKAQVAEHTRDLALARYHQFEIASAAFQIGIVLASAEVITGMMALAYLSGFVGLAGLAFTAIGLWAPHAVHLF